MAIELSIVDAFATKPFEGNPAAVCILSHGDAWPTISGDVDAWMQAMADEMNLSETAFVECPEQAEGVYGLRWFTPAAEVALCGHATLASAHTLWTSGRALKDQPLRFQTRYRGELICTLEAQGQDGSAQIAMDLPADTVADGTMPDGMLELLGVDPSEIVQVVRGDFDWLIELSSGKAVRAAKPSFQALSAFEGRGIALTSWTREEQGESTDIVSRFFAPRLRVNEDPVTGALHCLLGPYWQQRKSAEGGDASKISAFQASRRGGYLQVTTQGDRVTLVGQAVTVTQGKLAQ